MAALLFFNEDGTTVPGAHAVVEAEHLFDDHEGVKPNGFRLIEEFSPEDLIEYAELCGDNDPLPHRFSSEKVETPRHLIVTTDLGTVHVVYGSEIEDLLAKSSGLGEEVEEVFVLVRETSSVVIDLTRLDDYLVVEERVDDSFVSERYDDEFVGPLRESTTLGAFIARQGGDEGIKRFTLEGRYRSSRMSRQDRLKIDRRSALL